jgi:CBS domain-containing protein
MPRTIRSIIEDQPPITCSPKTTVADAARLMRQHNIGALMVVDDGELVGIFTERDALYRVIAEGRDPKIIRLAAVMTRDPATIHPDKPFADALHLMHTSGFRHVPVVENGCAIGMISARDALGPELEDFIYELLRQAKINDIRG